MKTALLILLTLAIPVSGRLVTRDVRVQVKDKKGELILLYVRLSCPEGKPGDSIATANGFSVEGAVFELETTYSKCPTLDEAITLPALLIRMTNLKPLDLPVGNPRLAFAGARIPSPADGRLYLANLTGDNARSAVDVVDTAKPFTASIDLGDRLFGGLQLSPDGQRLYAVMWPQTLGAPAPAQIAYIDTATNAIVDRFELPELLAPQAPALSSDGRYLYFSARATESGPYRIRVADLRAKTVSVLPDPVPANTELRAVSLSPDGALLCAAGSSSLSCYDTRTRTFLGRTFVSQPNASLRPVFHPNGRWIYLLGRSFVNNELTVYISVVNTATLTETSRIPIATPAASIFRDSLAVLTIDPTGSRLILDEGFSGVVNFIDLRTNRVIKTVEGLTKGAQGGAIVVQ